MDLLTSGTSMDLLTYKTLFPIFYFDVSKQSEKFDQSVVDVTVRMKFGANIPDNVVAHALIINDRRMIFKSNGKKLNVEEYKDTN